MSNPIVADHPTRGLDLARADAIADDRIPEYESPQYGDDTARRRLLARLRAEQSEQAEADWLWLLSLPPYDLDRTEGE